MPSVRSRAVIVLLLAVSSAAHAAAPGLLDASFAAGGRAWTPIDAPCVVCVHGTGSPFALAQQPDGKLVAAGVADLNYGVLALARYAPDGTLDPTFGTGGKVVPAS